MGECGGLSGVDALKCPPQSPHPILIEALWNDVEMELDYAWGRVIDLDSLEAAVSGVWNTISEERLDGLTRSMPARLQAVIKAGGYITPY